MPFVAHTPKDQARLTILQRDFSDSRRPHSAIGYRPPAPETILTNNSNRPFAKKWLGADNDSSDTEQSIN